MSNTDLLSGDVNAQAEPGTGEQTPQAGGAAAAPKRRPGGLSGMVIADLRALAGELGVGDTTGMRKGDLIAAIRERQGKSKRSRAAGGDTLPLDGLADGKAAEKAPADKPAKAPVEKQTEKVEQKAPAKSDDAPSDRKSDEGQQSDEGGRPNRRRRGSGRPSGSPDAGSQQKGDDDSSSEQQRGNDDRRQNNNQRGQQQNNNSGNNSGGNNAGGGQDDDERGGRRGRRFRDRRRRGGRGEGGGNADTEIREDDVLLPVAGILDVLENYAFVRTSGYLPGPNDVYVSLSLVRKYGLRRGDAITGAVRQPREGEQQRQKFNPLVRVDSVNGLEPDVAKKRPEFTKLTPLYPNERLRLETASNKLTTRVIDLVMPVGKGQRALIVSPPKAGKTTIMQDVANAITTNNPECHLMVVLVDERPEEVTDMQRSVKGEVIASTFDRPPSDHTSVAELSIERAKRLVEMGHDVVVLLDSITRLGRAYNLAAPASGRILSGGVDSTALFPPKRFLGAARNIEDGGSLTIFATAMVETGSTGDTVIFEEFKGTGNAELKLDRKIAERRVFPAVDVNPSGTRKEELLLSPDELAVTHKLHRVLHALDSQQAIDLLLDRLRKTKTNIEFLMQVSKTAPGNDDD
ncbi:transcription termination factor Rho [Prauserella cavernicola]|uniref:Transcription termination factor Rho n=1 Tax=Prauserella cavernicola TaxID=2800127 RepID=A0A934QSH5_9PSEU|nr:transcription termination factor Rho [Prauserella cavernicola]MBK1785826.1 transcription termination factor Rho [Prauserella cavernicola]